MFSVNMRYILPCMLWSYVFLLSSNFFVAWLVSVLRCGERMSFHTCSLCAWKCTCDIDWLMCPFLMFTSALVVYIDFVVLFFFSFLGGQGVFGIWEWELAHALVWNDSSDWIERGMKNLEEGISLRALMMSSWGNVREHGVISGGFWKTCHSEKVVVIFPFPLFLKKAAIVQLTKMSVQWENRIGGDWEIFAFVDVSHCVHGPVCVVCDMFSLFWDAELSPVCWKSQSMTMMLKLQYAAGAVYKKARSTFCTCVFMIAG